MKITRAELKSLIMESINERQSMLLEFPNGGGSRARMGPNAVEHDDAGGLSQNEGSLTRQDLFHLGEKANQLHALISDKEDLDPKIQSKITQAAALVSSVFDSLTYQKKNPEGQ
mgnify:CR=1 FL=1